jgi:ABC-type nitrate/sulfonate/bicarbonate transport system substrate-binding protein
MKTILNILIVILLVVLLYILIYPQYQENKPAPIRIGTERSLNSLVLFFAEENGFLKGQKLLPEYIFADSPDELYSRLLAKEIDLAVLPWSTIFKRVIEKGETVKVFISGNFRAGVPISAIFAHPKVKVQTLKDLKGKRFGYPLYFADLVPVILSENGLSVKDLILSPLPQGEIPEKLKNGELDCALVCEPYRTQLIKEGMALVFDAVLGKSFLAPFPAFAYAINPSLIREKRKVGVRLKIATDMAITLADKEPESMRAVLIKRLGLDSERVANFNLPEIEKLAGINKSQIQAYLLNLAERGVINREAIKDFRVENLLVAPVDMQP